MAFIAARARSRSPAARLFSEGVIARMAVTVLMGSLHRTGRHPVVADGDADPHRLFAGVLLRDLRGQPGDTADHEDELPGLGRKAEVVEHGGQGAIHVDGKWLDLDAGR